MTPRPLRRAGWDWAEGDERFFLEDYLQPLIDDRDRLASAFIQAIVAPSTGADLRARWGQVHRQTTTAVAASLLISAMLSDYRKLAAAMAARLPVANVIAPGWSQPAHAWLARHTPQAVTWSIGSHMGFWERPSEFNPQLLTFLLSAQPSPG
jgi:hypothetical protein